MKNAYLIFFMFLFSSCASLMKEKSFNRELPITSSKVIVNNDIVETKDSVLQNRVDQRRSKKYQDTYTFPKGTVGFHLAFPLVTNHCLRPEGESYKYNTGLFGLILGSEYYYKENQSISLSLNGYVAGFFGDIGSGHYEDINSLFLMVSNNYQLHRFRYGYGLTYNLNEWISLDRYENRNEDIVVSKINKSIGLALPMSVNITKNLYIGIIYRPNILQVYPSWTLKYEHILSLDWGLNFTIKNNKGR